ncbi:MAG TPA: hypothetical protein VGX00_00355 [Thermoplasmata archaeon]|nr:hypothetical protein [Thermoplasmata archaeon]
MQEIKIRELSRTGVREWIPPIGAMGGPPAHELYRDLVLFAGLRLMRDGEGRPQVAIRDGENRRVFAVPSDGLREAIDRFRMRRSLRPVPDQELQEFTRIAEARASDPDILVPRADLGDAGPPRSIEAPTAAPEIPLAVSAPSDDVEGELDSILREIDDVRRRTAVRPPTAKAPSAWTEVVSTSLPSPSDRGDLNESISGGRMTRRGGPGLPRYIEVLRTLIRDGGWLGTTSDLCGLTGDDPRTVVASLLGMRSELARSNIVVASVETKEGWRWLAVDRARLSLSDSSREPAAPPRA